MNVPTSSHERPIKSCQGEAHFGGRGKGLHSPLLFSEPFECCFRDFRLFRLPERQSRNELFSALSHTLTCLYNSPTTSATFFAGWARDRSKQQNPVPQHPTLAQMFSAPRQTRRGRHTVRLQTLSALWLPCGRVLIWLLPPLLMLSQPIDTPRHLLLFDFHGDGTNSYPPSPAPIKCDLCKVSRCRDAHAGVCTRSRSVNLGT